MSALTVTLGADITALRRSMGSATQLVSASARKMVSLTAAGLKVGLGAALAGGGVALADAGRKLIAFGEGADTVPETLRRIGDISAGIQTPVNEIAELYGKARVQGRLFAEDINQLTGRRVRLRLVSNWCHFEVD